MLVADADALEEPFAADGVEVRLGRGVDARFGEGAAAFYVGEEIQVVLRGDSQLGKRGRADENEGTVVGLVEFAEIGRIEMRGDIGHYADAVQPERHLISDYERRQILKPARVVSGRLPFVEVACAAAGKPVVEDCARRDEKEMAPVAARYRAGVEHERPARPEIVVEAVERIEPIVFRRVGILVEDAHSLEREHVPSRADFGARGERQERERIERDAHARLHRYGRQL